MDNEVKLLIKAVEIRRKIEHLKDTGQICDKAELQEVSESIKDTILEGESKQLNVLKLMV